MPGAPFSAIASASRNSTLRPPRPLPRTVTVVSPPESSTQGGGSGWPCWTTESAIPAMSLPTSRASPSSASPSISGATPFRARHLGRGLERQLRRGDHDRLDPRQPRIAGLGRLVARRARGAARTAGGGSMR